MVLLRVGIWGSGGSGLSASSFGKGSVFILCEVFGLGNSTNFSLSLPPPSRRRWSSCCTHALVRHSAPPEVFGRGLTRISDGLRFKPTGTCIADDSKGFAWPISSGFIGSIGGSGVRAGVRGSSWGFALRLDVVLAGGEGVWTLRASHRLIFLARAVLEKL